MLALNYDNVLFWELLINVFLSFYVFFNDD